MLLSFHPEFASRDWWYGHSPCVKTDPPESHTCSGETHARYHLVKTPYFGEILAPSHLAKFHSGKRSDVEETISRRGWVLVWWLLLPLLRLYALKIGQIFFFSSVALYAIYGKLLPQNSVKLCLTSVEGCRYSRGRFGVLVGWRVCYIGRYSISNGRGLLGKVHQRLVTT